jgi:hypothetical protein
VRRGTGCGHERGRLFVALEVATGQVTDACHPRHRHGGFLDCFEIIERQALRRGDFANVEELMAAIPRLGDGWNQRCRSFT